MADRTFVIIELFCLFVGLSGCVFLRLNQKEDAPYMDEVFHIPQVHNYCVGKFDEWDPMITTLPGLYLTTVGLMKPISVVFSIPVSDICGTFGLRSVNLFFAAGNFYLLYLLVYRLHGHEQDASSWRLSLTSFTLSFFPVLYFFTFLYYTDSGSTFCVLLMYLLSLHGNHKMAATVGSIGVLFRQTNIVWVVFVAGVVASESLVHRIKPDKKEISPVSQQNFSFLWAVLRQLLMWVTKDRRSLTSFLISAGSRVWPYVVVVGGFIAFVVINGSIVVGAKDDHQAILHFPQIFYFVSFSALFSFMYHISWSHVKSFSRFLYRKPLVALAFCVISAVLVWRFTFAHRYLLADNRHYTFYVWAKLFRRHELVKFALIPCYLLAMWSMAKSLEHMSILWKCVYCVCVAANLIPSPLLEFRYFIIPYLIYRLNMQMSSYVNLLLELALYLLVNFVTLYLFIEKPFLWENTSGYQRFMW